MHPLLRRQIRRHLNSETPPDDLEKIFDAVDHAYDEFDSDRQMVERSLELASEELLERNAVLQKSEEYFRSLIERGSDVILVVDTQGNLTYASPSLERVMGYEVDGLKGLDVLSFVHSDDFPDVTKSFKRAADGTNEDVPIEFKARHSDGSWRVLECASRRVTRGSEWSVAINFRDITERKRAEETIRFMAYHDALTGLPNRDLLQDRLDQALNQARRQNSHLAVIFLDIDRFKTVNDSVGHPGGDDLLRRVAERLSHTCREGDTLARVGGDEFVVLLPQVDTVQEAVSVATRVLDDLREPVVLTSQEFRVSASVGLAVFPDDGRDVATLIRNADTAMYRAKEQGGDNIQLYAPSMNAAILARLSMERELSTALERGEFVLYYQPLATVSSNEVIGAEALIRWRHPDQGLVVPDRFIPLAEETGLIVPIGNWVLEEACRQAADWEKLRPGFRVAVNVSARQLKEHNFVALVSEAIWKTGVSTSAIEIEVTETAATESPEQLAQTLAALQNMGIATAIDDFGTGYSSLSHLKRLPVTKLKIDRSFTQDVTDDGNDAAIARATIAMAHSLRLMVVAEGIEDEAQLRFYRKQGCDEYQGFLLARPEPAEAITELLSARAGSQTGVKTPLL